MGVSITTLCMDMLGSTFKNTEIITYSDGTTIQRKNPWVTCASICAVTLIILQCLDGGKGMISNIFGRRCLNCRLT